MGWNLPSTLEYTDFGSDELKIRDSGQELVFYVNDCESVYVEYKDIPVLIEFLQKRVPA